MSHFPPEFGSTERNNQIPPGILAILEEYEAMPEILDVGVDGQIDIDGIEELFVITESIAPHYSELGNAPAYADKVREMMHILRRIPARICDELVAEEVRGFLRDEFENLSSETLARMVQLDFHSLYRLRTFPADLIKADIMAHISEEMLEQMKINMYLHEPRADLDKIFDIYDMNKTKPSDSDDDGPVVTKNDEQKSMVVYLTRRMLPTEAKFYDQVIDAVDQFVASDYDLEKMNMNLVNALPLIDEMSSWPDESFDDMLHDMAIQFDVRGEKWDTFVGQIKSIDTKDNERWTQLLERINEWNTVNNGLFEMDKTRPDLGKGDEENDSLWRQKFADLNKRIKEIAPRWAGPLPDPETPNFSDEQSVQNWIESVIRLSQK